MNSSRHPKGRGACNLGTADLYGFVSVQHDSESYQMLQRMDIQQVGSNYAREGKECFVSRSNSKQ
jgi:hypothetical protein